MTVKKIPLFLCLMLMFLPFKMSGQSIGNFSKVEKHPSELIFTSDSGQRLRLTAHTDFAVRIQAVQAREAFFTDNHYEMVESQGINGSFIIHEKPDHFDITTGNANGILILLSKRPMRFTLYQRDGNKLLLKSKDGIRWDKPNIRADFEYDDTEHFCGMGHQAFGLVESIDLKGKTVSCNYGDGLSWGKQGVLTVPFYLSNKGYGLFLNSTFPHTFIFGTQGKYEFDINTKGFEGRMDFYFILGPGFKTILNRYTELTGRPRLPRQSIFGLQLSDKGDPGNNGEQWWKDKITAHRKAGFPFDHIVNDNRWRAGSGAWSGSWFEWDTVRYPDPSEYAAWCKQNNVTMTLDLNRNNASSSWAWKPEYNLPEAEKYVKEGYSGPDYSNPATRKWLWQLFWNKSFDPSLHFPGDALWIDETDEMYKLPDSILCADGRSWGENRNYYHFLIAKAIVQEGWDHKPTDSIPGIGETKRPFVWMRGMTAGAQRYATYWTGDTKCDYSWMKKNIRAMQTAGLCGFPYFNHDAGGYQSPGPNDTMYIQWGMALGSFTPIWRPHGDGKNKRWPLDRSESCQQAAMKYAMLRYKMIPYIYTLAHEASVDGMPMARSMVMGNQNTEKAWKYDLQYMWGDEMLIAPMTSGKDSTLIVWLPKGPGWYSLWTDTRYDADQELHYDAKVGELPVFVKEGSILPTYQYALSTSQLDPTSLQLDVYTGHDGSFALYEDDAVSERYKTRNEFRITNLIYNESGKCLHIQAAYGTYTNAPVERAYQITIHGLSGFHQVEVNGKSIKRVSDIGFEGNKHNGVSWSEKTKTLQIYIEKQKVNNGLVVKLL